MEIRGINEENVTIDNKITKSFDSTILEHKQKYVSILKKLRHIDKISCISDLQILLEKLKEEELNKKLSIRDEKLITQLKFGCLKNLANTISDGKRIDCILDALEIEDEDIGLLINLGKFAFDNSLMYLAFFAFSRVLIMNRFHIFSMQYLIIINAIFYDFEKIRSLFGQVFTIDKSLAADILHFLKGVFKNDTYQRKLESMLCLYLKNQSVIPKNETRVNKMICIYTEALLKLNQLQIVPPVLDIRYVSFNQIDFISFSSLLASIVKIIEFYINISLTQDTYKQSTGSKKRQLNLEYYKDENDKKREKIDYTAINQSLCDSLVEILSFININEESLECTMYDEPDTQSDVPYVKDTIDICEIKSLFFSTFRGNDSLNTSRFFTSIVNFMCLNLPLEKWNKELCKIYAFIMAFTKDIFRNEITSNPVLRVKHLLRFCEIYNFMLINNSMINDIILKQLSESNKTSITELAKLLIDHHHDHEASVLCRSYYLFAVINKDDMSKYYYDLCLAHYDRSIQLFIYDPGSFKDLWVISMKRIEHLIKNLQFSSKINKSNFLFSQRKYSSVIHIFEHYFSNHQNLDSIELEVLITFIYQVLVSFICVDECISLKNTFLRLFSYIIESHNLNSSYFIDKFSDDLCMAIDKLMQLANLDDGQLRRRILILFYHFILRNHSVSSSKLFIKSWFAFSFVLFKSFTTLSHETKVLILSKHIYLIHSDLLARKICCSDSSKNLLNYLIKQALLEYGDESTDTDHFNNLKCYIDSLFYCLVGFPNLRKITTYVSYIKDHPTNYDKTPNFKHYQNYLLALKYYFPSTEFSFALSEVSKYSLKKNIINVELVKFLSSVAQCICDSVKNQQQISVFELSQSLERCLHGSIKWPKFIKYNLNIWSHNLDFSFIFFLTDYYKTSSQLSSCKWILLSLTTHPTSHVAWWGAAAYLVQIVEENIKTFISETNVLPPSLMSYIMSLLLCYQQTLKFMPPEHPLRQAVLFDTAWVCLSLSQFFALGYDTKPFVEKMNNFHSLNFSNLIEDVSSHNYNDWQLYYLRSISLKISCAPSYKIHKTLIDSVKLFDNLESFDKVSTMGLIELYFKLCKELWKCENEQEIFTLTQPINNYLPLIRRLASIKHVDILTEQPAELDSISNSQTEGSELSSIQTDFQTSILGLTDTQVLSSKVHKHTSLCGMITCLCVYPCHLGFAFAISRRLLEISQNFSTEDRNTIQMFIINFLSGDMNCLKNVSSSSFVRLFLPLLKKGPHGAYQGVVNISYRASVFRKFWRTNRIIDGLCNFQSVISRGITTVLEILIALEQYSQAISILICITKEKNNCFMIEIQRNQLLNMYIEKIAEKFETCIINKPIQILLQVSHKFLKIPFRFIKQYKDKINSIMLDTFKKTDHFQQHFSTLPISSYNLYASANKYISSLDQNINKADQIDPVN